jgi:putative DNA primase/helicase
MCNLNELLEKVGGGRRSGEGWSARCPTHDDKNASLSVSQGDDGTILLRCHAGCSTQKVVESIGLTLRDLFPQNGAMGNRTSGKKSLGTIAAVYRYVDEKGELLHECVRYANPKDFRQRHPNGHGGYEWNLNGCRRVVYKLPELLAAHPEQIVFICEGEKDVDNATSIGVLATCSPMGAGKWRKEFNEHFRKREMVVILPDNDQQGRDHAEQVASNLHGVADSVKILALPGLPDKGDISDWLTAGGTKEQLLQLALDAPAWRGDAWEGQSTGKANVQPSNESQTKTRKSVTSAKPIKLSTVQRKPIKFLWHRRLLRGGINLLDGDPGLGKSFITLDVAARLSCGRAMPEDQVSHRPGNVLLFSHEDARRRQKRAFLGASCFPPGRDKVGNGLRGDGRNVLDLGCFLEIVER